MEKDSLEEKAGDVLDGCRLLVSVVAGSLRKQFPDVFSASVYDRFNFFGTIACVWTTCVRLHFEVAKELRTPLESVVQRDLSMWNSEAIGAFNALHVAVGVDLQEINRDLRSDQLFNLAARWVVEMAAGGLLSPDHKNIANRLARLYCEETAGYWRVEPAPTANRNATRGTAPSLGPDAAIGEASAQLHLREESAETEFAQWNLFRRQLNNELIVPRFRAFCRENELGFHFWDEQSSFDAKLARVEGHLYGKAMSLFNRIKPEFDVFRGVIVRWQFVDNAGDFKFSSWSVEEFVHESTHSMLELKRIETRYSIVGVVCWFAVLLLTVVLAGPVFEYFGVTWLHEPVAIIAPCVILLAAHRFPMFLSACRQRRLVSEIRRLRWSIESAKLGSE